MKFSFLHTDPDWQKIQREIEDSLLDKRYLFEDSEPSLKNMVNGDVFYFKEDDIRYRYSRISDELLIEQLTPGFTEGSGIQLLGGGGGSANLTIALDIDDLTEESGITDGDFIPFHDTDAGEDRKVDFTDFEAALDHDNLTGFVANEHIDHSTVTLTAGEGLTGTGDITGPLTFDLDFSDLSTTDTGVGATDLLSIHDGAQKKIAFSDFEASLAATNLSDGSLTNTQVPYSNGFNLVGNNGLRFNQALGDVLAVGSSNQHFISTSGSFGVNFNRNQDDIDFVVETTGSNSAIRIDAADNRMGIFSSGATKHGVDVRPSINKDDANTRGVVFIPDVESGGEGIGGIGFEPAIRPGAALVNASGQIGIVTVWPDTDGPASYNVTNLYTNFYRLDTNSGYTGTITNGYLFFAANGIKNGGTLTNQIGLGIQALTTGTNNIGIEIKKPTGTIARAIHSLGGDMYFKSTNRDPLFFLDDSADKIGIGAPTPAAILHIREDDSNASSLTDILILGHNLSSGTAASGLATGVLFQFEDASGNEDNDLARIAAEVTNASHLSEAGDLRFEVASGGSLAEKFRILSTGHFKVATDQTTDTAPNDDTTFKKLSLQKLASAPANAAYIAFSNNPGTDTFYLVLEEG